MRCKLPATSRGAPLAAVQPDKSRVAHQPTSSLMPSQREQVAVESLVQQTQQEQDSYPYAEDMNQSYQHQKDAEYPFIHDNPSMVNSDMMNFPPPYEPPMLPPMSPYPPGPGPGMPLPPNTFSPHMQSQHSMGPPQYLSPGSGQPLSPNFQSQQQQQLSQGPIFSHVPPGANFIGQNSHFPPSRSMGPMGMAGPPPGMPGGLPFMPMSLEGKIQMMNQRLRTRMDEGNNAWWESFAQEFFEDDSRLTVRIIGMLDENKMPLDKQQIQYTIGRTLIPRFFRSFFEGGCIELQYEIRQFREALHNHLPVLESAQTVQSVVTCRPGFCKVFTEGRLIVHFGEDESLRIRHWVFLVANSTEFIPRNILATPAVDANSTMYDAGFLDHIRKPVAPQGFLFPTISFLRMCAILEPMQEIMSHHRAYPLQEPRKCMETLVFQKWNQMYNPPVSGMQSHMSMAEAHLLESEAVRGTTKRRKRKTTGGGRGTANNNLSALQNGPMINSSQGPILPASKKGKNSHNLSHQSGTPLTPGMPMAAQDVMIVGEPTLMGGEFGDEDERLITRLENSQYDPHLAIQAQSFPGNPGVPSLNDQSFPSTALASSPRNSSSSWQQQQRPASATPSINNNDGKNRSPNH